MKILNVILMTIGVILGYASEFGRSYLGYTNTHRAIAFGYAFFGGLLAEVVLRRALFLSWDSLAL